MLMALFYVPKMMEIHQKNHWITSSTPIFKFSKNWIRFIIIHGLKAVVIKIGF